MTSTLDKLIALSRELGEERRELAILGEGNTSADLGDGTFLVKASGSCLGTIDATGFTRVRFEPVLEAIDRPGMSDADVRDCLEASKVNPSRDSPSMRRGGGFIWFANKANIPLLEDCYAGMVHASFADGHVEVTSREAMVKLLDSPSGSAPLFNNVYTKK